MNKQISNFARLKLKEGLESCTEEQHLMFKRMYSHKNLDLDINKVIDNMSDNKLNNAMLQVTRTLEKNKMKMNQTIKKWVIMDVDRTVVAKGNVRDRRIVPIEDTKKRLLTYTTKQKAISAYTVHGFYDNVDPNNNNEEYKLEAVEVEITIKEL